MGKIPTNRTDVKAARARQEINFVMIGVAIEPTRIRKNTKHWAKRGLPGCQNQAPFWGLMGTGQYASPLCVGMSMAVFNFPWNSPTKVRVMCSVFDAPFGRLFTSQRVRHQSWYGRTLFFSCFLLGLGWGAGSCWGQEDVVEMHLNWGDSEWLSLLDHPSKSPLWRAVHPLDSLWNGVEVLDERLTWEPCLDGCLERLRLGLVF